jgi:uncharacterized protein YjbI with pentapeptide repeats
MSNTFDLQAFRERRDNARARLRRWEISGDEFLAAYAAGERDFALANLYDANLESANLIRANLYGANLESTNLESANLESANLIRANLYDANLKSAKNLINARGIYVAFAPGMSSRSDYLYGGINADYDLVLIAGCFHGSADELRAVMSGKSEEWRGAHQRRYEAAIRFIEECHAADREDGAWERMKERAAAE